MNVIREYFADVSSAWNQFWFVPRGSEILGLIRILTGAMVLYTHLVWTFELQTFLGGDAMLPASYRELLFQGSPFAWSHLDWFSGAGLMIVHVIGLIVVLMFTLGWWTRWTSALACLLAISYANRATGAQFGLDQINCFLCLYLTIGNSGGAFSLDRWWRRRNMLEQEPARGGTSCVWTNIAVRLIQIHMCIVYLFAGLGKLQGNTWWNGEAIWGALASYEYQTIDMTWLAESMWLVNLITLVAIAWEVSYPFLVWPKLTRPIVLALAIPIHLGIGLCMGMMTFGLIMLVGNLAFVPESWLRRLRWSRVGQGD